jgi:hypothetical protein
MSHLPRIARFAPRALGTLLACAIAVPAQTTVTVPCAQDNTLYESATGSLSNARGTGLYVGVTGQPGLRRALVKFDVAATVPAGARVLSAELGLYTLQTTFGGNVDVAMHRVLQSWGEGTSLAPGGGGSGGAATTGDATWLHRFYPSTLWSAPGGDFAATPSATVVTPPFGACSSTLTAALVGDVQTWLDNPTQNHGWLLKTNEALPYVTRKIASREATAAMRPVLSVTYVLPGQSAAVGQGCPVNGVPFTLALGGNPIGGQAVSMVQSNGPAGQLAANLIGLVFDPVGAPLLPQCRLLMPLGSVIATDSLLFLDAAGGGSTSLSIPPGFGGVSLVIQSAAIDNGPAGFVLSNAVFALLQ